MQRVAWDLTPRFLTWKLTLLWSLGGPSVYIRESVQDQGTSSLPVSSGIKSITMARQTLLNEYHMKSPAHPLLQLLSYIIYQPYHLIEV